MKNMTCINLAQMLYIQKPKFDEDNELSSMLFTINPVEY
jgi:hypothetical protein